MRVVMCLCGHKITAEETEEAWRLLDTHCAEAHGDPFQGRGGANTPRLATDGYQPAKKKAG